ncbi:MAG: sensor histidine kinase KdpD [Ardenticatenaceae bacterium]|nr:sensor histidine kinase KdpD [Ardenticatenaceae bacterium]MCB9442797.1 sensor histidine kinase KdpD [Ardenticatenaceae bacterium]
MANERPDFNEGLRSQQKDNRKTSGKLKIFLGYAAGVGKTYTMLEAAQQREVEGIDVAVGYVETHGRSETNALLAGLETIPRQEITYRGITRSEMDTDAILQRRPQIVLVDDLAHTNAPGSRHLRRYQDVLELLNSGIDVYTTINIQHLESLNDIVSRVTGVAVRETVPDHILDEASEIELVDLPINELLNRLETDKVYVPEQDEQALRQFFRPGNLTALREMALRRVADRVDEQMRAYMQMHAIPGPWPAGERLMVCISSSPLGERLVRTTRRLARRLDAEWIAVYVETPGHVNLPEADEDQAARTLRLAEELGAQTVRLTGNSVAKTLVDYALSRNVTKIVVGKPLHPRWREWLRGSIIDQVLDYSQDMDVYVISGKTETARPSRIRPFTKRPLFKWQGYLLGAGLVILVTLLGLPLRPFINPTNLVMLYLAAVMITAVRQGRWPAIVASLLSVIVFDITFVPPYYTFVVAHAEYLLTFVGLLAVGLVISTLAARTQEQALAARHREAQTAVLFELSQGLAAVSNPAAIAQTAVNHIQTAFNGPAALFLPDESREHLMLQSSTPNFPSSADEHAVAGWVFRHSQPAGRCTDTLTNVNGHYLPLQASGQTIGVMAVEFPEDFKGLLSGEQRRFLTSFSNQVALALESAYLADQARRARLLEETEKLQTTLLNSISHDLRTPLATITGALSSLLDDADLLTEAARRDLQFTAWEEALRLNRFVGNLLDMTRLESGAMKVVRQPYDVQELVGATLAQMPNRLRDRTVKRMIPDDLPPIAIDLTLMIQALMNLVDNAVKYTPPDEPIEIEAHQEREAVIVAVKDRGPGIPEAELERVFSKFFRLNRSGIGGTGLGLSIARGIVEAHNGRIWAENRPEGGAIFSIALPTERLETDNL